MSTILRRLRRFGAVLAVLVGTLCVVGMVAGPAQADPANPCELLHGAMKKACENTQQLVDKGGNNTNPGILDYAKDPIGSLAASAGQGASFVLDQISDKVNKVEVNYTNLSFLKIYAIVFGASAILAVICWLFAVIKRALQGVPPAQAIGEAIGLLWLSVLCCAFTPVVLAMAVSLTDSISSALIEGGQSAILKPGQQPGVFLGPMSATLKAGPTPGLGGSFFFLLVAVGATIAGGGIWLELLMRVSMLYIGAALIPLSYAAAQSKDGWAHVRRSAGVLASIDFLKPILIIVLLLGEAVTSSAGPSGDINSLLAGLGILLIAAFGQAYLYKLIPAWGDDLAYRRQLSPAGLTPGGMTRARQSAAALMGQGLATHGGRDAGGSNLGRIAVETVRMQPGSGAAPGGDGQSRMRPETPSTPSPRRPD